MDKRKRGEGENMLGDRLQDNISARAETRGFSEQQADSQDAGRLSNATMPPVGTYLAGLLPPLNPKQKLAKAEKVGNGGKVDKEA